MAQAALNYSRAELMAVCSAREIKNGERIFVGTGLPMLGAMLAKRTHAPDSVQIYESGVIDSRPTRTPISIGDCCLVPDSAMLCGLTEVFGSILQPGYVDVGFIGAAQIDRYGNINTSVIGDYFHPKVRLPGSGGANEIGSLANRVCVMMVQDRRKFSEKVDYVTTPGYLSGPGARQAAGLPRGGPSVVITQMAIYRFDEDCEMCLVSVHPGVTVDDVGEQVAWDLRVAPEVEETAPPIENELRLLREELDPKGIFLGSRD